MEKKFLSGYGFYVIEYEELIDGEPKYWATAQKIHRSYNLVGYGGRKVRSINNCNTFKEAKEIARAWNEAFKSNGTRAY